MCVEIGFFTAIQTNLNWFAESPYDEDFQKYEVSLPHPDLKKDVDREAIKLGVKSRFDMICIRCFLSHHRMSLIPVSMYA